MSARRLLRAHLGALLLAASCDRGGGAVGSHGRLEARWTGADTAAFAADADADWCDSLRVLEISAMRNDTGAGLAIFPGPRLASGTFPVKLRAPRDTLVAPESAAPSAALGLRWFARTLVRGYRADSGQVALVVGANGRVSGRFTVSAVGVYDTTRLHVTGSFSGLEPRAASRGCRRPVVRDTTAVPDSAARRDSVPSVE